MKIFKKFSSTKYNRQKLGDLEEELETKENEQFKKTKEFRKFAIDGIVNKPLNFVNDRKSTTRNCFLVEKPDQRIDIDLKLTKIIREINDACEMHQIEIPTIINTRLDFSEYEAGVAMPVTYSFNPFSTMGKLRAYPFEVDYSTAKTSNNTENHPFGRMQLNKKQELQNATLNLIIQDQIWHFKLITINRHFHLEKVTVEANGEETCIHDLGSKRKIYE